jgi:hypothetical protein
VDNLILRAPPSCCTVSSNGLNSSSEQLTTGEPGTIIPWVLESHNKLTYLECNTLYP